MSSPDGRPPKGGSRGFFGLGVGGPVVPLPYGLPEVITFVKRDLFRLGFFGLSVPLDKCDQAAPRPYGRGTTGGGSFVVVFRLFLLGVCLGSMNAGGVNHAVVPLRVTVHSLRWMRR